MRNFFCFRARNRTGRRTARGFAGITILRVLRRGGIYAARCNRPDIMIYWANPTGRIYASPTNLPEIGALPITAYLPLFVGRGLDPSLPFCGNCQFPRRGGVTPPAVLRLQQHNGSFVGAAYMPPVAACRTFPPHPARSAPPSPTGGRLAATKNVPPHRGGTLLSYVISVFSTVPLPRPSARANRRGSARHPGQRRRCSRGAGR